MSFKILFANLGYARGIDGSLRAHLKGIGKAFYNPLKSQKIILGQIDKFIQKKDFDLCCFVEIEKASFYNAFHDQILSLIGEKYPFYDIADKYGEYSLLGKMPLHQGKCNGFMSKENVNYERKSFKYGYKKLIHIVKIPNDITLIFSHFSLKYSVRQKQLEELADIINTFQNEVIVMADFNILNGLQEINGLIKKTKLELLNDTDMPTFYLYNQNMILDLCLCSTSLLKKIKLDIEKQPYSDHAALIIQIGIEKCK